MALPNYVKFQRGTLASYNRLSRKDDDTLYFIYDPEDASRGSLYLGARLIGEVGGSGGASSISELSDVLISSAQTGDFLVLNSEGKWINTSAQDVAESIIATGGNFVTIDENEFQFNAVSGKLELKGYAAASTNMMPVKSATGITWQTAPSINLDQRVGTLETNLAAAQSDIAQVQSDLQAVDGKISTAIGQAAHLKYQVIANLAQATDNNVIYLYNPGSSTSGNLYEEYMLVNGVLERIGSLDVDLSNYVTTTAFENALNAKANASALTALDTRVGTLETSVSDLSTTISGFNSSIAGLNTRVGVLESNANNYVTTTTFQTVVGNLEAINGTYNNLNSDASVADNLIEIYERLTWQEIHD